MTKDGRQIESSAEPLEAAEGGARGRSGAGWTPAEGAKGPPACALHDPLETLHVQPLHLSPMVAIYDVCCRPRERARGPEEWSRENQIIFPRRGVFERELGGETLIADSTRVLFFNRDQPYRVAHPAGSGDDCTVFTFDPALLAEAVGSFDPASSEREDRPFRFGHAASDERTFVLHHELLSRARQSATQHFEGSSGGALAIDEAATELLGAVLAHTYRCRAVPTKRCRNTTPGTHREQAQRTVLFLATHLAENLSLAAIARAVHCSPFHLARLFREQSGVTIHQYRHRLRLREALRRVVGGENDLSALALDLGFSSHSHLTDAFRHAFGAAPRVYRERLSRRPHPQTSKNLEVRRRARP